MQYHSNTPPLEGIYSIPICTIRPQTLTSPRLLDDLPLALKTANGLALLKAYLMIPQPRVRRFILSLLTRITGGAGDDYHFDDISEAEYLLAEYAKLPTGDMRGKVIALVRDICVANRGAYDA